MKPIETLEAMLKRYYRDQRRALPPDESLDRKVLEQTLAKQSQACQSSGRHLRRRLLQAVTAAAAIFLAAFIIHERNTRKEESSPQKPLAAKPVSQAAGAPAALPTLFQVNLILREKGFDEACKRLTYAPRNTEHGTTLRSQRAMRLGTDINGS